MKVQKARNTEHIKTSQYNDERLEKRGFNLKRELGKRKRLS